MNNSLKYFLTFTAGVAVGTFLAGTYLKKKYDEILDEQIESANEELEAERERVVELEEEAAKRSLEDYRGMGDKHEGEAVSAPYIITPEQLGDIEAYDVTTLYYYADGALVNLNDEIVEDVEGTVGLDFAEHFGEFEDDSVCIRNEAHECDYEILKDPRIYADIKKPARPIETEE